MKEKAAQILEVIKGAQSILLHFHPSPDPDSVGGSLALMHVLKGMGKKVTVLKGDSDIPPEFSFFPGIDQVLQKNWHEINHADYDLLIVQDSTIDRVSNIEKIVVPATMKVIVIDHHKSNEGGGLINILEQSYPSNCELLFDIFVQWGTVITPEIAHCLLIGIYTDTGGFRYDSVRPHTFEVAAALAKIYPAYTKSIFQLHNSNTKAAVRFLGLGLSNIKEFEGGLALVAISSEQLTQNAITENDTSASDVCQRLISVIGWDVGVCAIEFAPHKTKISFRTRNSEKFDLSVIAGTIGGGGHKGAAGAFIEKPLDEAVKMIVDAFNMYRSSRGL